MFNFPSFAALSDFNHESWQFLGLRWRCFYSFHPFSRLKLCLTLWDFTQNVKFCNTVQDCTYLINLLNCTPYLQYFVPLWFVIIQWMNSYIVQWVCKSCVFSSIQCCNHVHFCFKCLFVVSQNDINTPVLRSSLVSFLQSNHAHDRVHQRLVLVDDPAEPVEERHGSGSSWHQY